MIGYCAGADINLSWACNILLIALWNILSENRTESEEGSGIWETCRGYICRALKIDADAQCVKSLGLIINSIGPDSLSCRDRYTALTVIKGDSRCRIRIYIGISVSLGFCYGSLRKGNGSGTVLIWKLESELVSARCDLKLYSDSASCRNYILKLRLKANFS